MYLLKTQLGIDRSVAAGLLLSVLVVCVGTSLHAGDFVFSPYSATSIRPEPSFAYYNPAFAYLEFEDAYDFGASLPVGLLAILTVPERNPILYQTNPEKFQRRFDALSFYDQLRYPTSFLVNPGESPGEVVATVRNGALSLGTNEGEGLHFEVVAGAGGVSKPFSPLIPPPLLSYQIRPNKLNWVTGLFIGPTGHSVRPDAALDAALQGAQVEPEREYELSVGASATGGFSQSVSYPLHRPGGLADLTVAPRVVTYYRAVTARAEYETTIATDENALPRSVVTEQRLFFSYPGEGWGGGGRIDLGTAVEAGPLRVGLSALNLFGAEIIKGTEVDPDGDASPTTVRTWGTDPAAVVSGRYAFDLGKPALVAEADAVLSRGVSGHVSGALFHRPGFIRLLFGYRAGWEGALTIGIRNKDRLVGVTLGLHQSAFTHRVVWGVGVTGRL